MSEITISIADQDIVDLLTTGFEGGMSPWIGSIDYLVTPPADYEAYVKYAQLPFWEGGGKIRIHFDGGEDEEGSFASSIEVTFADLEAAIKLMPPSHLGDFLNENYDAITGDVFLQMLCLKELIYG